MFNLFKLIISNHNNSFKPNQFLFSIKYIAKFGIDGGISHGFALKESSYCEKEETFELKEKEENDENALVYAVILGYKLSRNHLSNPKTEYTIVTLLNLKTERGEISQEEFISQYGGVKFKNGKSLSFKVEDNKIVLSCHMLEHLLTL